jgi:hypothetical protein
MEKKLIPKDKAELIGFLKALDVAFKVWSQGTITWGSLHEYRAEAETRLKKYDNADTILAGIGSATLVVDSENNLTTA